MVLRFEVRESSVPASPWMWLRMLVTCELCGAEWDRAALGGHVLVGFVQELRGHLREEHGVDPCPADGCELPRAHGGFHQRGDPDDPEWWSGLLGEARRTYTGT